MPVVVTVPGLRPGPGPTAGSPWPTAGSPDPGSPGWARLAPNPG